MALSFPTGRKFPELMHGYPLHADSCRCSRPLLDVNTERCVRCGRHPTRVISRTWERRQRQIAERAQRKGAKVAA